MDNFSSKIENQKNTDRRLFSYSLKKISGMIKRKKRLEFDTACENPTLRELGYIFTYLGLEYPKPPKEITDDEQMMVYLLSVTGVTRRKIHFDIKRDKNGALPVLCELEDGTPITLIPMLTGGYARVNSQTGALVKLTKEETEKLSDTAYCFYKPLPNNSLTSSNFIRSICHAFSVGDVLFLIVLSSVIAVLGLILPAVNHKIFNDIIPSGQISDIGGIAAVLFGVTIVSALCYAARSLWLMRISNKISIFAQNAVWARIFRLPTEFFSQYQAGEITQRADCAEEICSILNGSLLPTLLSAVFALIYLFQIAFIAPSLLSASVIIVVVIAASIAVNAYLEYKYFREKNSVSGKLSSFVFQVFSGISKIKISGAEVRAFAKWSEMYSEKEKMPCFAMQISSAVNTFLQRAGIIILYITAYRSNMDPSAYIAFYAAFGALTAAVLQVHGVCDELSRLKPLMDMLSPILQAVPENQADGAYVSRLRGEIELNQVDFRYAPDMPLILDNLSLHIKPGEYIAVTGASGCGKSTLMRILMGFETPESGAVYYDEKNIDGLDKRSLRQRIGVVLQNGKLFAGDIYSNIAINAPELTQEEAWEAAEAAGFAEDIRHMPMEMFTMISDGGGGISGGQRQRLLIARALASKPDILMFDEATSALDNITQKQVVNTISKLNCTRIVIAHRLSTIKDCDRIVVLDKGSIAEDGTYEELIKKDGLFCDLVKRQQLRMTG